MDKQDDVVSNFNLIAKYSNPCTWDHNNHYHVFLLNNLPEKRNLAYEIGCGLGSFTSKLAERFSAVVGVDYASDMISRAKEIHSYNNVTYFLDDFTEIKLPTTSVDLFASIATLHHLPFEASLQKMKNALKPGGRILILDLYQEATIEDYLTIAVASLVNRMAKLYRHSPAEYATEIAQAWREHTQYDSYMKLNEIREVSGSILPEAVIRRHLYWRYSLIWTKPQESRA